MCSFHTDYSPVLCARKQRRSEYMEPAQGHERHVTHSVLCSCRSYPSVPSFTHCLQSLQFSCSYELAKAIHVSSGKVKAVCKMFSALPEMFASLWEMIENHRGIDWCTDLCNLLLLEFIEMSLCSLQKWGHSQAPGYLPTPLPPVIFSGPGQNQT